jgi:hypothetical protein
MPTYMPTRRAAFNLSLLLLALVCGWCQSSFADAQEDRVATALLRVHQSEPVVLDVAREEGYQPPTLEQWWTFRNTMAQLVESPFVLEWALRRQEIADIPAIKSADDPIAWVRERVDVDFPGSGEIMRVRLADGRLSDAQLENVLDSVVEAFITEVVEAEQVEKMRRKALLQDQLDRASNELNTRRQEYFELVETLGGMGSPAGKLKAEMLLETWRAHRAERRELQDRLADEYIEFQLALVELGALAYRDPAEQDGGESEEENADECDQSGAPAAASLVAVEVDDETQEKVNRVGARYGVVSSVLQARIRALDQDVTSITKEIERHSKQNAELEQRREDLERKAELVDQMGKKLALWDVQLAAGPRVQLIQDAQIQTTDGNQ